MPKTYNRNIKEPKFYSTAAGRQGYNPQITSYYNVSDDLVRVEELWREEIWAQTISGTTWSGVFPDDWESNIDSSKTNVYSSWELVE